MKRNLLNGAALLVVLAGVTACAKAPLVDGQNITLKDALVDTVHSIDAARTAAANSPIGLNVCTVTVKFNVDAKDAHEDKLGLSAGPAPVTVIPVPLSATASTDLTGAGERTNTITLVLATADPKKAAICKSVGNGGGSARQQQQLAQAAR